MRPRRSISTERYQSPKIRRMKGGLLARSCFVCNPIRTGLACKVMAGPWTSIAATAETILQGKCVVLVGATACGFGNRARVGPRNSLFSLGSPYGPKLSHIRCSSGGSITAADMRNGSPSIHEAFFVALKPKLTLAVQQLVFSEEQKFIVAE